MSIASELSTLNNNILTAYSAVSMMGGTVPSNKNMARLAASIASIPSGGGGIDLSAIDGITSGYCESFTPTEDELEHTITTNLGAHPKVIIYYLVGGFSTGIVDAEDNKPYAYLALSVHDPAQANAYFHMGSLFQVSYSGYDINDAPQSFIASNINRTNVALSYAAYYSTKNSLRLISKLSDGTRGYFAHDNTYNVIILA